MPAKAVFRYETVSIFRFLERRWRLAPLSDRDRNALAIVLCFVSMTLIVIQCRYFRENLD